MRLLKIMYTIEYSREELALLHHVLKYKSKHITLEKNEIFTVELMIKALGDTLQVGEDE